MGKQMADPYSAFASILRRQMASSFGSSRRHVLAADSGEQPDRPRVGQRELEFGFRSVIAVSTAGAAAQAESRAAPGSGLG